MSMFTDPEVKMIIALRGGFGTIRILPYLDYDLIRKNAKILIGYSDITSLHLAIHRLAGIVTYHGGVALSTFNDYSTAYFQNTLSRSQPVGRIHTPESIYPKLTGRAVKSRGPLTGGNLTLISASLGTPYEIDTRDKILFIEEVGEEPYSIDRMLCQLAQAGKLEQAKGLLFDRCEKCKPSNYQPAFNSSLSVEQVILDHCSHLKIPVLYGLSLGHVANKPVMPLGIEAEIDPVSKTFSLVQAAVSD